MAAGLLLMDVLIFVGCFNIRSMFSLVFFLFFLSAILVE